MRATRLILLALSIALPVAAQSPSILRASLLPAGFGGQWFSTNKPAYVAIISIGGNDVAVAYSSAMREVRAGSIGSAPILNSYSRLSAADNARRNCSNRAETKMLLVASTDPLRVPHRNSLPSALAAQLAASDVYGNMSDSAHVAAIVAAVLPDRLDAEVAVDCLAMPMAVSSSLMPYRRSRD